MANFILIRDLSEKRGITLRELAKQVDLTEGAIQKIIATGSTKTSTLEVIAHALKVHPGVFFDDYTPTTNQSIANGNGCASSVYGNVSTGSVNDNGKDKDKEIEHLKELLKEKERTIQILMGKK